MLYVLCKSKYCFLHWISLIPFSYWSIIALRCCPFLLYSNTDQLYVCSSPCLHLPPTPLSHHLGHQRALSWGPWAQQLPPSRPVTRQCQSAQPISPVRPFATPWTAARQASLSITNSRSPPKLMVIESVMPSNHLILCRPLLLLPPIPPSIRVFSNESALRIRWPKYWRFSFSISPSNEHPGLISFRMDWLDLL